MEALKFADSYNMIAYMEKSMENADFDEIVDFLTASPIRYALTVSPTIYVSYIEQFWSTAKIKTVNNKTQIHAKVIGKIVVIADSSVRRDLHFDDEDGITYLTNIEIFEKLQLMGYEKLSDKLTFQKSFFSPQWKYLIHTILQCLSSKSTAWNEFGTNIASAVICLAKNQKFNFSKLIFDAVFNDEYDTPSHTKKVFANMRRQGKEFLGTVTPLFPSMLISQAVEGEADETIHEERGDSVERAATTAASLDAEPAQTRFERLSKHSNDPPLSRFNTLKSGEDSMKLNELMEIYTRLSERVLALENIKTAQNLEITNLKKRVKKLEKKKKARTPQLKRMLFKVRIECFAKKSLGDQDEEISWFQEDAETHGSAPVTTAGASVSTVEPRTPPTITILIEDEDLTIAQTLMKMRSVKSKEKSKEKGISSETVDPTP
ncbi:hypothetical protein Tco_1503694 [Tanacetum coccineum]